MLHRIVKYIVCLTAAACLLSVSAFAETGVVTPSKGVNMRSGPGKEYKIVTTLSYGAEVEVTGTYGEWYSVSYGGQSGYVSASYLRLASGASSAPSIFSGGTQIQSPVSPAPSGSSALTGSVSAGTSPSPSIYSYTGTVTGDYVRFRTGPSVSYTIKTTLRKGTQVTVTDKTGDWLKCTVNGETGFVSAQYVSNAASASVGTASSGAVIPGSLTSGTTVYVPASGTASAPSIFTGASAPAPVTSPSLPAAGTASAGTAGQYSVVNVPQLLGYISGSNVRFRTAPSLEAEIIGEFQYGNSIYITGFCGDWTAGTADGKSGFVSSRYVREGTVSSSLVQTAPSQQMTSSRQNETPVQPSASPGTETVSQQDPVHTASVSYVPVTGQQIADLAVSLTGSPYQWAGTDPETGFDCSGLVWYVFNSFGIPINRTASDQARNGIPIDKSEARPGDVVCFYSGDSIAHSGIYIGDNKFVHSASSVTGVVVSELSGYYYDRGYEVRRIIT